MNKIYLECDPKTGQIHAAKVLKNGALSRQRLDVTDTALPAVAEHLLRTRSSVSYTRPEPGGGQLTYRLNVQIIRDEQTPWQRFISHLKRTFS